MKINLLKIKMRVPATVTTFILALLETCLKDYSGVAMPFTAY